MAWAAKRVKWNWRKFLTADEAAIIKASDEARAEIVALQEKWSRKFGRDAMMITNRAIQRAKHAALKS